jgi:UDP-3-O-[3-hydroxymyristoyl] glucosamine N-acyltransferase LpxD
MLRAILHEQEIRRIVGVPGNGERVVDGISTPGAGEDRSLYFVNKKLTADIRDSFKAREGCIVIVPAGSSVKDSLGSCLVFEADDPRAELAKVLRFIRDEQRVSPLITNRSIAATAKISPLAVIEGAVEIADGVVIEPFCVVGPDVRIGRGSILRSGARVHPRVVIGENSVIGSNTIIGQQGFGFVRDDLGNKVRMPQLAGVVIGSNVEIGGLVSMPSGTIVPTIIEDNVKIDELVHVAHNARVAKGVSLIAGVVIGGHAVIDEEAWVGMNSSVRQGRRVGSHALVGMDASIQQDVADNAVVRAPRPDVQMRKDDDHTTIGFPERG